MSGISLRKVHSLCDYSENAFKSTFELERRGTVKCYLPVKKFRMDHTRTLFALSLSSLVINLSYGLIMPFIPLYLAAIGETVDLPVIGSIGIATQIGFLAAGFMISRAFLAPKYGALSDSSGRKPIILVGLIFYGFISAMYGFASSFWLLFVARFFQGVASAAVWPVAEALVADTSSEEKLGRNLGLFMFSMQIGWAVGPFMGSAGYYLINQYLGLSDLASYRALFLSTALLSFLSAILAHFLIYDPKQEKPMTMGEIGKTIGIMIIAPTQSTKSLAKTPRDPLLKKPPILLAMYGYAVLNGFAFSSIFPLMTIFLLDYYNMSTEAIGVIIGLGSVVGMFMNPLGGWLSDRKGRIPILWFSTLTGGFFILLLGIKMAIAWVIAVFILRQMSMAIRMPVFRALQSEVVPADKRGEEFGTVQMFFNIGAIIGPIFGGVVYDKVINLSWVINGVTILGIFTLYAMTIGLSLLSLASLTIVYHKEQGRKNAELKLLSIIEASSTPLAITTQEPITISASDSPSLE